MHRRGRPLFPQHSALEGIQEEDANSEEEVDALDDADAADSDDLRLCAGREVNVPPAAQPAPAPWLSEVLANAAAATARRAALRDHLASLLEKSNAQVSALSRELRQVDAGGLVGPPAGCTLPRAKVEDGRGAPLLAKQADASKGGEPNPDASTHSRRLSLRRSSVVGAPETAGAASLSRVDSPRQGHQARRSRGASYLGDIPDPPTSRALEAAAGGPLVEYADEEERATESSGWGNGGEQASARRPSVVGVQEASAEEAAQRADLQSAQLPAVVPLKMYRILPATDPVTLPSSASFLRRCSLSEVVHSATLRRTTHRPPNHVPAPRAPLGPSSLPKSSLLLVVPRQAACLAAQFPGTLAASPAFRDRALAVLPSAAPGSRAEAVEALSRLRAVLAEPLRAAESAAQWRRELLAKSAGGAWSDVPESRTIREHASTGKRVASRTAATKENVLAGNGQPPSCSHFQDDLDGDDSVEESNDAFPPPGGQDAAQALPPASSPPRASPARSLAPRSPYPATQPWNEAARGGLLLAAAAGMAEAARQVRDACHPRAELLAEAWNAGVRVLEDCAAESRRRHLSCAAAEAHLRASLRALEAREARRAEELAEVLRLRRRVGELEAENGRLGRASAAAAMETAECRKKMVAAELHVDTRLRLLGRAGAERGGDLADKIARLEELVLKNEKR